MVLDLRMNPLEFFGSAGPHSPCVYLIFWSLEEQTLSRYHVTDSLDLDLLQPSALVLPTFCGVHKSGMMERDIILPLPSVQLGAMVVLEFLKM